MVVKADVQLDAKGLACPMPIVKTKKAMNELVEGQVLEVQATDKGSKADLAAWANTVGHQYIGTSEVGDILFHYIRKCNLETSEQAEQTFEATISNEEILHRAGLILDVREEAEYAFGHVPGAKSIPMGDLEARMKELDMNQEIYVICRTGTRSDMAATMLAKAGFKNVYNVLPGMLGWTGELTKEL
ncbi:sulfurtransferase TusA family protein [Sporosarcina obsidiansis]|uniref:sulfurtransferase TusA family protein n=1 Tax=Sporosarcina obsidiansis TaxID=2660748 RepID=UPI00129B363C|nr:sulfurtransferase TusA family protein [Sporosarcina obsidiansis]